MADSAEGGPSASARAGRRKKVASYLTFNNIFFNNPLTNSVFDAIMNMPN